MIQINIEKAKSIAHDVRRLAREKEFAPLDKSISAQIPGTDFVALENERAGIRQKYSVIQLDIDSANTADQIKTAAKTAFDIVKGEK
jgi:hypothetical protein